MEISAFKIQSEAEADDYLRDMLANPDNRSLGEIQGRANRLVEGDELKRYFTAKGAEILKPNDG